VVPPASRKVSRVSRYSGFCLLAFVFVYRTFTFFGWLSQNHSTNLSFAYCSPQPHHTRYNGLASFPFARHYLGNRVFFLFLWVLRCFSSPRSPCMTMDSSYSDWAFPSRVSPFGHLRIVGCLHLPVAFRSLPRPSSAPGTKAFTLRSFSLDRFVSFKSFFMIYSFLVLFSFR
jgi:hypothetical protein